MAYQHPLTDRMQPPSGQAAPPPVTELEGLTYAKPEGTALPYGFLTKKHPEYDLDYWTELRALYLGGKYLLRNPGLLSTLFPKHTDETESSYTERKKRAFYISHLAAVIDVIVAGLAGDPIRIKPPGSEDDENTELDEFWQEFGEDCTPPGGARTSFNRFMLKHAGTGLLLGRFATLVDLPKPGEYLNERAQREAGALDPYTVEIAPECLFDWERDDSGELSWVNYCRTTCPRKTIFDSRNTVREEYRIYDRLGWVLYVVEYSKDESAPNARPKPKPDDMIRPSEAGAHRFGRVPILYDELSPGLWAGNKLHSMVVEYFNKSCGLSWAEYKTCYAQLYEFLADELGDIDGVPNVHQADSERARRTKRGPGNVQVRGSDDKAEYLVPDASGYAHVAEQLRNLRQDIYRIMFQMALAEDNTGGLVRRSEESKNVDHQVTDVILGALAQNSLRPHAERVIDTGAAARGEEEGYHAGGFEDFADVDLAAMIEQAATMELIPIPSATYQKRRYMKLIKADLGDEATAELLEVIEKELEVSITQEKFEASLEADIGDEEARNEEALARGSEAGRVQRGQLPVAAKKPPKPAAKKKGKK